MTERAPAHRDRSAAVKHSIRTAATTLFTERGYEATGIRDIAALADVNPALVIRHFGSKESLFIQTVDNSATLREILEGPIDDLGRRVVRRVLAGGQRDGLSVFGIIVRASGRADIREHLRTSLIEHFVAPLVPLLDGPHAELRAHLFVAQFVGLLSAIVLYDDRFLGDYSVDDAVELYGAGLQGLLNGVARPDAPPSP